MAKKINLKIIPQTGDILKYTGTLMDNSGNVIERKEFLPPFPNPIEEDFTNLEDNKIYQYFTSVFTPSGIKACPSIITNTMNPVVNVVGTIKGQGKSIVISAISQSIPCPVSFFVYGVSDNGIFSTEIVLPSGQTSVTKNNADGNAGIVQEITPSVSGGSTFIASVDCNGTTYRYTLSIDGVIPQYTAFYGATDLDTTSVLQPESAYVSSVNDTFTGGGALSVVLNSASDLAVSFPVASGDEYKVRFIQVPASESYYTKWSEVGNPYQQDLPIPTYGSGVGGVWFRTERDGETLYVTRAQTKFNGAIKLSR